MIAAPYTDFLHCFDANCWLALSFSTSALCCHPCSWCWEPPLCIPAFSTLSVPTRRRRCGCDLLFLARTPPARVYPWCCRDLLLLASASLSNSFMCSTVASFNKILWIDVGPLHAGALIKTITSGDTNLMSSMFPWSYYILRTWVTESP